VVTALGPAWLTVILVSLAGLAVVVRSRTGRSRRLSSARKAPAG
jgi:hypothetical protein